MPSAAGARPFGKIPFPSNLGGGVPLTVAMLARLIAKTAGLKPEAVELGKDTAMDSYVPDLSLVRERLGLTPQVDLTDSVAAALRWVRAGAPGARNLKG